MPVAEIDGGHVRYRLSGEGPAAVLTPGGRAGMDDLDGFVATMRGELRLVEWDRRNTGGSDLWLGPASEQARWVDDLAELLTRLDLAPAWLLGGSAGARVAYLTALRHPELVRGLVLWSVSGGPYGSQVLGYDYHVPYINAARRAGMAAVAATPHFAARIAANHDNEAALLGADPLGFAATLQRWNEEYFFRPDTPAIGITEDEARTIAVPTLLFEGNDDIHPAPPAQALHRLIPGSRLEPCAWTRDEFMDRLSGRIARPVFDLYPRLTPTILEFVRAG
jgi:pimeloyl-ACP methyl ester carboxylesterase